MKLSCLGSSAAEAVRAGNPSVTRKTATPASSARIVTAAITAVLLKIRSPRRRRPPDAAASSWPALVVVSNELTARDLFDRPDRGRYFFAQFRGERRGAGLFFGQRLPFGAGRVFEEAFDQGRFGGALVFGAADQRGDQDDRVDAARFRFTVDFEGDDVFLAFLEFRIFFREIEHLGRCFRRRFGPVVADFDQRFAEFPGLRGVGVTDRAFAGGDGFDHTGGAGGRFATFHRPFTAHFVRPHAGRHFGEVVGEVFGRARLVGAVDRDDPRFRKFDAGVLFGDFRVVPVFDFLVEDLRQGFRFEFQFFDAREVVDDRDRRDVVRDLDQFAGFAAFDRLAQLAFRFGERRVGARVGDALGDEFFATAAGADTVIGDGGATVGVLEFGEPGFLRGFLRGRAGTGDFARSFSRWCASAFRFAFAASVARAATAAATPAGGEAEH